MFSWLQSTQNESSNYRYLFDHKPISCMELLLSGYSYKLTNIIIPKDILFVIAKYFIPIFGLIPNLFVITSSPYKHISSITNIATNKTFTCSPKPVDPYTCSKTSNIINYSAISQCCIENGSLPYHCLRKINSANIQNKHWSMIAHIGGKRKQQQHMCANKCGSAVKIKDCVLTAIHSSSFLNTTPALKCLDFKLPSFPEVISDASVVYSKLNNKIYVMGGDRNHCNDNTGRA
eukprot:51825_1